VQLIATAHGNTLENLLQNPTLSDLVGGIQAVTLSDEEARRRGTQKTVLERKAPPTFDVLIEIQEKDRLAVHHDVAEVVDRFLREIPPRPELRTRLEGGGVEIQKADRTDPDRPQAARGDRPRSPRTERSRRTRPQPSPRFASPWEPPPAGPEPEEDDEEMAAFPQRLSRGRTVRIFPYAVSKAKLDKALKKFRVAAYLVDDLDDADMVVTIKAQERRQPRRLRDAQARGIPFYVVRSNTITQMENFLRAAFGVDDHPSLDEAAVREVEEAVDEVQELGRPVELSPQNNHLRRLQHELVERFGLTSESKGQEPYRRVVVFPGRGENLTQ